MNKGEALKFSGTHKEIGIQVGELYKQWGKKDVWIPQHANDCFDKQLATYQKYFPEYIEYLEGVALGLNLPKDKCLLSYLTGFVNVNAVTPKKCSVFAINNSNGVLIGRNYDWRQASETVSCVVQYSFIDKFSNDYTGITDMATWQFNTKVPKSDHLLFTEDAWNTAGLYVCLNGTPDFKPGLGLATPHAIQLIVEKCKTTEEAVALIAELPIVHSTFFTIADSGGNLAVVEKPQGEEIKVIKSNKQVITTNHYNYPELVYKNIPQFKNIPFHSTYSRYHYLQTMLLNNPEVNLEDVMEIMSQPPVVQNWRSEDVVTCWVSAINLTNGKYFVQVGPLTKTPTEFSN